MQFLFFLNFFTNLALSKEITKSDVNFKEDKMLFIFGSHMNEILNENPDDSALVDIQESIFLIFLNRIIIDFINMENLPEMKINNVKGNNKKFYIDYNFHKEDIKKYCDCIEDDFLLKDIDKKYEIYINSDIHQKYRIAIIALTQITLSFLRYFHEINKKSQEISNFATKNFFYFGIIDLMKQGQFITKTVNFIKNFERFNKIKILVNFEKYADNTNYFVKSYEFKNILMNYIKKMFKVSFDNFMRTMERKK